MNSKVVWHSFINLFNNINKYYGTYIEWSTLTFAVNKLAVTSEGCKTISNSIVGDEALKNDAVLL